MSALTVHFDGDFSVETLQGPPMMSIDTETRSRLYRYTYWQTAKQYALNHKNGRGLALGSRDANGAFYVDWEQPREVGGGIVEFARIFAQVPEPRTIVESFVATWQFIDAEQNLVDVPIKVTSRLTYTYYHTLTPESISLRRALKFVKLGNVVNQFGEITPDGAEWMLGEDEQISKWKGFIWCKTTRLVPVAPSLTAV